MSFFIRSPKILSRIKNTRRLVDLKTKVEKVCVALDGEKLVALTKDQELGPIEVWNLRTGDYLTGFGKGKYVFSFIITPDGQSVIASSEDPNSYAAFIDRWDLKTGALIQSIPVSGRSYNLAITPNGTRIVTSSSSVIEVWESASGAKLLNLEGFQDLRDFVVTLDGTSIISTSGRQYGKWGDKPIYLNQILQIWDLETGHCHGTFEPKIPIENIVVMPNGTQILTDIEERELALWKIDSLKKSRVETTLFAQHRRPIWRLAITRDGRCAVTSVDRQITVWGLEQRQGAFEFIHETSVLALCASPQNNGLIAGDEDGNIIHWSFGEKSLEEAIAANRASGFGTEVINENIHLIQEVSEPIFYSGTEYLRPTKIWTYFRDKDLHIAEDTKQKMIQNLNKTVETMLNALIDSLPTVSRGERKGELRQKTITDIEIEGLTKQTKNNPFSS